MSFIKVVFKDETIEILNLRNIEHIRIEEDSIDLISTEGNEYAYLGDTPKSEYNIINFNEVKEKLLKLCDD